MDRNSLVGFSGLSMQVERMSESYTVEFSCIYERIHHDEAWTLPHDSLVAYMFHI